MTTFVLLHGAYQGPWIYKTVAERLRNQGHTVYVPCLDGCAERAANLRPGITTESHADEVASLLFYEDLSDVENDLAIGMTREDAAGRAFKTLEPQVREWAADRITLHPRAVFYEPVKLDSFWQQKWDASVIYCKQAPNPGRAHQERCANTLNARWHEIDTGHYPMLSTPDELARLIAEG